MVKPCAYKRRLEQVACDEWDAMTPEERAKLPETEDF